MMNQKNCTMDMIKQEEYQKRNLSLMENLSIKENVPVKGNFRFNYE